MEGAPVGTVQRVTPEGTIQVPLSNSDVNRIICPAEIKDVVYSKEKGMTVKLSDTNAFVKFLVMKKDGRDLYTSSPSELYVACGDAIYTLIALPKRIPAQTVQLVPGKVDSMKKNMALFGEMPFEKKVVAIIKKLSTDSPLDTFTVEMVNKPFAAFKDLDLVLYQVVAIDGEGLRVKEYRARIRNGSRSAAMYLREKDFLRADLAEQAVAVSIDVMNLKKGETARVFIVERVQGGER